MRKLLCIFFIIVSASAPLHATPLDDYVHLTDKNYKWTLVNHSSNPAIDTFTLNLTSQQWRSAEEVDKPLWEHALTIVVPKRRSSDSVIMVIGGGVNGQASSNPDTSLSISELALNTQAIICKLSLVPNQHLKFADEKDTRYKQTGRREDALVAYTWDKFMTTGDSTWPIRLPMTKAVVRAMDATEEFIKQQFPSQSLIDGFILVGNSKRGWAAWTTAAVDKRVKAIVPIVIDLLRLKPSYERHYRAYGNWSPAIKDYVDMGIEEKWHSPEFEALMQIVEPYSYSSRYTMPKYIINASGDEFFLPDTSRLYFDKLPGEKHLLYIANTGHHISPELYKETLTAYISMILSNSPLPKISWNENADNTLTATTSIPPTKAIIWQAENPKARDFRIHTIGNGWKSTALIPNADGTYKAALETPKEGFSASYIEFQFMTPSGHTFSLSTDVFVLPDLFVHTLK